MSNGRCDAEIGSPKLGWHSCNRKAVVASERTFFGTGGYYELHYCVRHEKKAHDTEGSKVIRLVKVRSLV